MRVARRQNIPHQMSSRQETPRLITPDLRLVAIMSNYYFREFARCAGFPDNYTTIDLETSGFDPVSKLLCTYGYTRVRDRQPVETQEVALNWTQHPDVDQLELREDLEQVQRGMERQGKVFHHTYAHLRDTGIDPIQALEQLLDLVETAENDHEVIVMHNGWAFDVEFMKAAFHNWLRIRWEFHENLVYDSGIIEKASQLEEVYNPLPYQGESMKDFAYRIRPIRALGVMWSLDQHCAGRYDLMFKAGVNPQDAHKAGSDSLLIHHLIEEHRKLADVVDQLTDDGNDVVFPDG